MVRTHKSCDPGRVFLLRHGNLPAREKFIDTGAYTQQFRALVPDISSGAVMETPGCGPMSVEYWGHR